MACLNCGFVFWGGVFICPSMHKDLFFCSGHLPIWICLCLFVGGVFFKIHLDLGQDLCKWNAYEPFVATWVHEKKIYLGWFGIEFQASLLMASHLICARQISHSNQTAMTALFSGESISSRGAYRGLSLSVASNRVKT